MTHRTIVRSTALVFVLGSVATACAGTQAAAPGPVAAAPAPSLAADTPPVRLVAPTYQLFASTEEAAQAARTELDSATVRFRRLFGAEPPPLGVVVFTSVEAMRGYDWAPLRAQGLRTLPWLVMQGEGAGRTPLGLHGPRAMSHEACHMFMIGHTSRTLGRTVDRAPGGPSAYGDASMPDWFEEGIAVACEPPSRRAQRREQMRSAAAPLIPLAELFRMEHPAHRQIQAMLAAEPRDSTQRGQPQMREIRIPAGGATGSSAIFYPQTQAVLEFLEERGPGTVAHLGEGLARGQTMEQLLASAGGNVPRDIPSLEREWKAWFAAGR